MVNVDLVTLLKVAPFPEEQRQKILANLGKLTGDQRYKLITTAWTALSQMYYAHLKYECDKLMLEIREGKRPFNNKDFNEVESKLLLEFSQKLKAASTKESLDELRDKLKSQFIGK